MTFLRFYGLETSCTLRTQAGWKKRSLRILVRTEDQEVSGCRESSELSLGHPFQNSRQIMALISIIDLLAVTILCGIALSKGLEPALPFVAFVLTLAPVEAVIPLPGLFGLTTQRLVVIALARLYLLLPGGKSELSYLKTPLHFPLLSPAARFLLSAPLPVQPILAGNNISFPRP